jgi:two-component system sensor histidine kinase CreC
MKLGLRIFGWYLIIFIVCFSYPIGWVLDTMRLRYLEGVEDPLVDQANILAGIVGRQMALKQWDALQLSLAFQDIYSRRPEARIYQMIKSAVDAQVYITDTKGKVIFDSTNPTNVGADFSMWRDVRLTLEGRYGARSTLANPDDPTSSVLFVAAPILVNGRTAGVITVGKPTTNINNFLKQMKPEFFRVVSAAFISVALLGYLVAHWITRPIKRLTDYAQAIHDGRCAAFPALDRTEIGDMGRALNRMQEALEGKAYIEQYVQKLTHEVKSPLSAIRGAAELLEENVPAERRRRFLENIRTEANRIQTIVDRMLELAALEAKHHLPKKESVALPSLIRTVVESKRPMLSQKQIHLDLQLPEAVSVQGDPFLLHQAAANLIQNAIDFSAKGGTLDIALMVTDASVNLTVTDDGAAIPDYALEKIFDKFFSLQRPDSGKKSTGLGLNLVREVVQLHQGDIRLENLTPKGVRATLSLPTA